MMWQGRLGLAARARAPLPHRVLQVPLLPFVICEHLCQLPFVDNEGDCPRRDRMRWEGRAPSRSQCRVNVANVKMLPIPNVANTQLEIGNCIFIMATFHNSLGGQKTEDKRQRMKAGSREALFSQILCPLSSVVCPVCHCGILKLWHCGIMPL